ncbi:uncharacterized protein M421DRAFT_400754 [Didymella exigua CBS 183.55]|uniref:Uncharacterized protein n=1 Tax=Didymella exigua CBS 183.55 TaxID=1150837 RepID=A0A6A5R9S8_9PLEO|nr:uncharacterized protein M421DRAFT_400754 [Didymella exigua CBS 183.55]KAF1924975.1 hypothetical protein M421DRAFT_400754 [Didymella exigua CBS 183.55]
MPKQDSVRMLLNELQWEGADNGLSMTPPFEAILDLLEYLPLAITQAASFMRENNVTPGDYVETFKEVEFQHAAFLNEEFVDWRRDSDMPNALLLTWKLSFEQIKENYPLAAHLLAILSVLDCHGVALWMLDYVEVGKKWEVWKALQVLQSFSFYNVNNGMHRLVQLATRAWIGPDSWNSAVQDILRFLCNVFGGLNALEWGSWGTLSDATILRIMDYYPHTKSVLIALSDTQNDDRTLATLHDFFAEWGTDGLVSGTFTEEATGVYQTIVRGDYGSLVEMHYADATPAM